MYSQGTVRRISDVVIEDRIIGSIYIGRQWRNFVPYLCQLVSVAVLWVKLLEMFVTLMTLMRFVGQVNDHVDIFLN